MNKNIIISILAALLISSVGSAVYFFIASQKPPQVQVKEVTKEVIKEVTAPIATDHKLCEQIPLYTGSFEEDLRGLYPNVAQDVCRLAFAVDRSSVEICKDVKGPVEIRGMCYALIATKAQDAKVCDAAPFEARDRCYSSLAKQTGDVAICEKIRAAVENESCITSYVSKTGNVEACKKVTTANGRDNCYMNQAYRDPTLCDKIANVNQRAACKKNNVR